MFIHITEISPALTLGCEHKILSLCPLERKKTQNYINSKPCDLQTLFGTYGCLSAALLVFRHLSASPTLTLYTLCLCKVYCIPVKLKLLAILFHLSNSGSRDFWRVYPSCCRVRSRLQSWQSSLTACHWTPHRDTGRTCKLHCPDLNHWLCYVSTVLTTIPTLFPKKQQSLQGKF